MESCDCPSASLSTEEVTYLSSHEGVASMCEVVKDSS